MTTEPNTISVPTLAGVENVGDPAGTVTVTLHPGDNVAALHVSNGGEFDRGTTVFLDYGQITALMVALGHTAGQL
jgi:hypothetical protein